MRVVLLTSDAPRHRALARRIGAATGVELCGVAVQAKGTRRSAGWVAKSLRSNRALLASTIATRLFFQKALNAMRREESRRFGDDGWPQVPVETFEEINGEAAVAFMDSLKPDLIAVSGTRMIKVPVFALAPRRGLLNLHTGLSPFYKGGPNCTLWALARREPQFIGATLHELDPGIDSGRLILTAQTPVDAGDTAASLMWKSVELGADLYVRVLEAMAAGRDPAMLDQRQIAEGRTFYTREWNVLQLARALAFVRSGGLRRWVEAGRPGAAEVRLFDGLA